MFLNKILKLQTLDRKSFLDFTPDDNHRKLFPGGQSFPEVCPYFYKN